MTHRIMTEALPEEGVVQRAGYALQGHCAQSARAVATLWGAMLSKASRSQDNPELRVIPREPTADLMSACHAALVADANLDGFVSGAMSALQDALLILLESLPATSIPDLPEKDRASMGQSREAAERSAHVTRGGVSSQGSASWPVVQLADKTWQLRIAYELEARILKLRGALHETLLQITELKKTLQDNPVLEGELARLSEVALSALTEFYASTGGPVTISLLGGNCPVQAEGEVSGKPFYFRARGSSWRLEIQSSDVSSEPAWGYEEDYGTGFEAGWMTDAEAIQCILKAADFFRKRQASTVKPQDTPATGFKELLSRMDGLG